MKTQTLGGVTQVYQEGVPVPLDCPNITGLGHALVFPKPITGHSFTISQTDDKKKKKNIPGPEATKVRKLPVIPRQGDYSLAGGPEPKTRARTIFHVQVSYPLTW